MLEPTPRKFTPEEHAQLVQMQARQSGKELDAQVAASEMRLRQWCVEQAVSLWLKDTSVHKSPEAMANALLSFVTAPLKPEQP